MARGPARRSRLTTRLVVMVPPLAWYALATIVLVAPRASADVSCNQLQSGSYQSLFAIPPCGGVTQPLVDANTLVDIRLQVWGDSLGVLRVLAWDPVGL